MRPLLVGGVALAFATHPASSQPTMGRGLVVAPESGQRLEYCALPLVVKLKAVFVAEYKAYGTARWSTICSQSATNKFNTTRFKLGLPNGGGRLPCATGLAW